MNENKNENEEFQELVNEENYTKNNKKEKIILFSSIGIIVVFTLVMIILFTLFNKKYELTINYDIPESSVQENLNSVKVFLEGNDNYLYDFTLDQNIILENIKDGNYEVTLNILNDDSLITYKGTEEVYLDDNKTIEIPLSKKTIKYSINYTWVGNSLNMEMPEGYDKYLVYKKDGDRYYNFASFDENTFTLNNLDVVNQFKFSVVEDDEIFQYTDSYEIYNNTPPTEPMVSGLSSGETVDPLNTINLTFSSSDPENDDLLYSVTLEKNGNPQNIQSRSRNTSIILDDLDYESNYTIIVTASDGNSESETSIDFQTRHLPDKTYLFSPSGRDGVTIYEVVDPRNPTEINNIKVGGTVKDVVKDGNYIFILRDSEGINIANISDPMNPDMIKSIELDDIDKITIAKNFLYIRFNDERVGVYSLENLENPEFLGFTEIKYYGSENPEIRYINTNQEFESEIITTEYQIWAKDQRITVEEYSIISTTSSMKQFFDNNYSKVFDNLRLVSSMHELQDFKTVDEMEKIKDQLKTALTEMYGKEDGSEIKNIILKIK
jgi:flagellar basal body-associated protein FliL